MNICCYHAYWFVYGSGVSLHMATRPLTLLCRWAEVVTHVPCGGSTIFPAGRLLIRCTQDKIDGEGSTLGTAGPRSVWRECPTITAEGEMIFDIDDMDGMEEDGTLEGVILHEMGHVIGIG